MRDSATSEIWDGVGLLNKAFRALDLFTPSQPTWTQAEICRETGLSRSTVNRLVRYFCRSGYLVQPHRRGRYGLGPAAVELGQRAIAQLDLNRAAMPLLEDLARETQETTLLAAYRPGHPEVICVAQIPSSREGLCVFQRVGSGIPLHAGAVAKAVLAYLPEPARAEIVEQPLQRLTNRTIVDPAILAHDLDEIRARGYATSREETYPGVYGVGAPVFGPQESIIGGLAVAAPLHRMDPAAILSHANLVVAAANSLSRRLGAGSSVQ